MGERDQASSTFHGQSAQNPCLCRCKGYGIPRRNKEGARNAPLHDSYKLLSQLAETGLVIKKKEGKGEEVSVPDFSLTIKNTAFVGECKVTPRNILAFDSADTPAGRMFIERYGPEKFAKFVELYDDYQREKTTSQLMARESGVIRFEIELLLSDIESIAASPIKVGHRQNRR